MLKGYLYKQSGSGLKPFQKRYFVFENDRISYYVAPNKSKKGEIFISKMIGASLNPSSKKKHCFVVECKDRRYTFLAESNEEAQTWVSEINKILLDVHHIPVNAIAEKVEDYKVMGYLWLRVQQTKKQGKTAQFYQLAISTLRMLIQHCRFFNRS